MTFDLEHYEDAVMSGDDTRRMNAGLELAEAVPTLERDTLERFGQPIVDVLLQALRETDWEFRNLIANALVVLGKVDFVGKSTWFWKKLVSTYTDVDAGLRSSVMDVLKELGRSEYSLEILEPLIKGLQHEDKDMRILSANTLGRLRAREVVPILLKGLDDQNSNVVYNLVECLGDIGDPRAVPSLMSLLTDHDDDWVHVATLEALGKIGDQRVVGLLLSLVKDELVVDPLINALGMLGDTRAIPLLSSFLKDKDREIRELAINALVSIWNDMQETADFSGVAYELDATRQVLRGCLTVTLKNTILKDMNDAHMPETLRENCALLLSCVQYAKALRPIAELLEQIPLSQKILYALGQYGRRAFPHLTVYLRHDNFQLRESVALYLQNYLNAFDRTDSQIEQVLLQLIEDRNPLLTQIAFDAIKDLHSPRIIPALVAILHREPHEFGDTIVDILAAFPKHNVYNAIAPSLDEADENALPGCIKLLGYGGARLDELRSYLKHENPLIQEAGILAVGFTGRADGIRVLLPFIMSRRNSLARCAAAQSLDRLIASLGSELPSPQNVFDALFGMLDTYRSDEELVAVAQAFGTLFRTNASQLSEVNLAVVRRRLLDLLPNASNDINVGLLQALQSMVDISSLEILREMRAIVSQQVQEMVASLYSRLPPDLRVIADVADMISHAEYSFRKFWILAAGRLKALSLTDMLIPLLAEQDVRAETFQAFVMMGKEVLPYLARYVDDDDPRIQKMSALLLSRIAQDYLDRFCQP
ncbi:hypothetical protein CSB45_04595 [candidate division KSB3 bacterium]|uniref:HEAT repeat domain-containing protein n=1 Tax=candidate division KSB3 bacterium TaxID=2044937 RepID=A0A2G6E9A8_9BACT|nr:MAG: hypothetical protein CSB45_04595 [candidate division KSB3 bacterium]PIE30655.1 MAG: hypothetical protein CSA57_03180 [candidate division KSB3 bacterium]